MQIIKLVKNSYGHYYVIFDEVPELTYEKVGFDYIGTAKDDNGNIILSEHLKYNNFSGAFAGRKITLNMKDGTNKTIKDYWYDNGHYSPHGKFVGIGAGTLEKLQRCYVYYSININKAAFMEMVEDYLTKDKMYEYKEIEEWCKLQYQWYNVVVNGKQIPYMMNKYGDMVEKESKKRVYPRLNVVKKVNGRWKEYTYFKFEYKGKGKLIKIHANYLKTLKATLPFTEEEIIKNCKIPINQ